MGRLTSPVAAIAGCLALFACSASFASPQDCDYDLWKDVSEFTVDLGLTADNILHIGEKATFELKAHNNCKWTMKVTPGAQTWPNWQSNIKLNCTWKTDYANETYPMTGNIDEHHVCVADVKHPIHDKKNKPTEKEQHPLMVYPGKPDAAKKERYVHLRLEHEAASSNEHGGYAHGGGEE